MRAMCEQCTAIIACTPVPRVPPRDSSQILTSHSDFVSRARKGEFTPWRKRERQGDQERDQNSRRWKSGNCRSVRVLFSAKMRILPKDPAAHVRYPLPFSVISAAPRHDCVVDSLIISCTRGEEKQRSRKSARAPAELEHGVVSANRCAHPYRLSRVDRYSTARA